MDIPGYSIQRKIGGGSSTHVYLALQHTFGASVAIKIVPSAAAGDPAFRERFLREAKIAQGLDHPNIVRVFDAGVHGDALYWVMEYARGGDLDRNMETGMHMQNVLRVVKDIAAALDYAHAKGVVHRDLKPQNILFDEQGRALLSGFGIAAAVGEHPAGSRDFGVGKSKYTSPEQVGDGKVDARSDFYSLGVVFYRMLTGRLPIDDGDGTSTGSNVREPPLPLQLTPFQNAMRTFLARSPGERFQSGAQIVDALDAIRSGGLVIDAMIRTEAVAVTEIEAAVGTREEHGAHDSAPVSRLRQMAFPAAVLGTLLLAAVVVGIWYVASRPEAVERALAFAGLVEHPDVVNAWQEAEALRRDPDQSLGAVVAAYRRVLAHDARYAAARTAIVDVAEEWKRMVGNALDSGDTRLAEEKLNALADVFPEDPALATLDHRLRDYRRAERLRADTDRLLARWGLSHVPSVDSAIVVYKEVLRLIPNNAEALAALNRIAMHYGGLAEQHAAARDVAAAMADFSRAINANAEFEGLAAVRATLSKAEALQAEIDALLQQAADLRQADKLIDPPGSNAAEIYRRVLAAKPEDAIAIQGLSEVSAQVRTRFDRLLEQDRLAAASDLRDRAAASGIGDDLVAEMNARYDAELARIATVKELVAEAEALYEQGWVTTGPTAQDDNAVARLREALRLDPDNIEAIGLLSVAARRLAEAAEDAYNAGMAEKGLRHLDLALTVTPGIRSWRERRERWQAEIEQASQAGESP